MNKSQELLNELDESKADTLRNNMPGFVGPDFAKKASDDDLEAMSDIMDTKAAVWNTKMKPLLDSANALRKKYKLKPIASDKF